MAEHGPIIQLEGVYKSFNGQAVLKGIDLSIQRGKTTVIIGPSGCGKTVVLKHIVGILKPDSGKVFFAGQEVSAMSERQLVDIRRRMGFLFQGAALFDSMSVEENVCFPMAEHNVGNRETRLHRCSEVLAMVGMNGTQHKYPEELSGGQKKRVALARAIALDPQVIFYDEPTTGLDPIRADLINELILKLSRTLGNTAVVVTHDMKSAMKVGDRIVMLHNGELIIDTTPDKLETVDNEIVARFVEGRASEQELAQLDSPTLAGGPMTGNWS